MSGLPEQIDPWKAADQNRRVRGSIALSDLPRVAQILASEEGQVTFDFTFFRDGKRRPCLEGAVETRLLLECQRCLGPVPVDIHAQTLLCVVQGFDEAEQLPEQCDPLMLDEDVVRILNLIEDELILALPSAPMHEPGSACEMAIEDAVAEPPQRNEEAQQDNPFQILEQLKKPIH